MHPADERQMKAEPRSTNHLNHHLAGSDAWETIVHGGLGGGKLENLDVVCAKWHNNGHVPRPTNEHEYPAMRKNEDYLMFAHFTSLKHEVQMSSNFLNTSESGYSNSAGTGLCRS
jgi:hypothetical protein